MRQIQYYTRWGKLLVEEQQFISNQNISTVQCIFKKLMGTQLLHYSKDHYQVHKENQMPCNLKSNPHICILCLQIRFKLCMNSGHSWLQTFRLRNHYYVMPLMPNITYCWKHQMSPTRVSELRLLFYGLVGPWMAKMLFLQNTGIFRH
jgi:hypothetical protein